MAWLIGTDKFKVITAKKIDLMRFNMNREQMLTLQKLSVSEKMETELKLTTYCFWI